VLHAQQAVEKSLKALLAVEGVEYPWTHDLGALMDAVGDAFPSLSEIEQDIVKLTRFAVEVRYRANIAEPDYATARHALDIAHRVYDFVEQTVTRLEAEVDAGAPEAAE